ncbi:MAG: FkbM family methyltransferase [Microcystis aeruginosa Ma_MB_S_20031200_S102]|uniref:FkbM family methyltransferase n=1 Tax=Microcystis aeruginosa Ma_MB_S_20031200_S102 TaxID=2486254 RepID=A0A552F7A4_MICAE|nr:MAG: FkbM family methyltransferase [Microcystis aeruginosa Ma_MB_S_20031200_S102D]TRU42583.1 MAG: FkbM family methyltransferase [Microcystis aeruginosa Ma_MB_S_20031200_S102]
MTSDLLVDLKNLLAKPIDAVINYETSVFGGLLEKSQGQVVLFGSGNLGKKCLNGLRKIGIEPVAFADNNVAIWNTKIGGVEVLSPEIAAQKYGQNALFLITVFNRENSLTLIQRQLHQLGCQNVAPCAVFFWCYPQEFLPHFYLDLPHKIYEQAGDVIAAFDLWQDTESKREYLKQIKWRILLESDGLFSSQEIQYFPTFLKPLLKKEVFVDCGTFDGDTLKTFIDLKGASIEKIICFEPDPINVTKLKGYLSNLDNQLQDKVIIYQNATGKEREKLRFLAFGSEGSAISSQGNLEVDSIPLDEIIADEAPTFIKMDIEGAEIDTILGASHIIEKYTPILAISTYHLQDHLWRLPLLVNSICSDYSYFLIPHGENGLESVFYAIPNSRFTSEA